jgi:hypothetical protein
LSRERLTKDIHRLEHAARNLARTRITAVPRPGCDCFAGTRTRTGTGTAGTRSSKQDQGELTNKITMAEARHQSPQGACSLFAQVGMLGASGFAKRAPMRTRAANASKGQGHRKGAGTGSMAARTAERASFSKLPGSGPACRRQDCKLQVTKENLHFFRAVTLRAFDLPALEGRSRRHTSPR